MITTLIITTFNSVHYKLAPTPVYTTPYNVGTMVAAYGESWRKGKFHSGHTLHGKKTH